MKFYLRSIKNVTQRSSRIKTIPRNLDSFLYGVLDNFLNKQSRKKHLLFETIFASKVQYHKQLTIFQ